MTEPTEHGGGTGVLAPARKRWPWVITWGLVGGTVLLIVLGALRRAPAPAEAPRQLANVETRRLVPREYRDGLTLPARVEAERAVTLSSEVAGHLAQWHVAEGATVSAGQPVAVIDARALEANLALLEAQRESAAQAAIAAARERDLARLGLDNAERAATTAKLGADAAQANLDLAGREFERTQSLAKAGIATPAELDAATNRRIQATLALEQAAEALDAARTGVEAARARVAQAEAGAALAASRVTEAERGIDALKITLSKTVVTAPFAGQLDQHLVEPGEYVSAGAALGRLYDLSTLRALVRVADRYVPFLDVHNAAVAEYIARTMPGAVQDVRAAFIVPGLPKLVGGASGLELPAEIVRIALAGDPGSNTFAVELRFANPGQALKEGTLGEARLEYLRYPAALVIPMSAVQVADVGPRALVVVERDGRAYAEVRDLEPLAIKGEDVLVGRGLAAGDAVIVAGGKGVVHGEEVNVVAADRAAAPVVPAGGGAAP